MIKIFLMTLLLVSNCKADWRVGAGAGYGAAGIDSTAQINGVDVPVSRSDGPLAYTFSIERAISAKSTIGIDLFRGVSLGPFSEGVTFLGMNYRYYYPNMAPFVSGGSGENSTLMLQEYCPFIGGRFGIAQGQISRNRDLISDVTGSGVFAGMQLGFDYQSTARVVYRTALSTAKTLGASDPAQTSLSELTLLFGAYYIFD